MRHMCRYSCITIPVKEEWVYIRKRNIYGTWRALVMSPGFYWSPPTGCIRVSKTCSSSCAQTTAFGHVTKWKRRRNFFFFKVPTTTILQFNLPTHASATAYPLAPLLLVSCTHGESLVTWLCMPLPQCHFNLELDHLVIWVFFISYMYILILIDVFITYIVSIDGICEQEGGNDSDAGIATHLSHFCHSPVTV